MPLLRSVEDRLSSWYIMDPSELAPTGNNCFLHTPQYKTSVITGIYVFLSVQLLVQVGYEAPRCRDLLLQAALRQFS